jgi:hypothetical protein
VIGDGDFLVRGNAGDLGLAAFLLRDLGGFRLFARSDGFDLTLLARFGFLQLAFEFENGLAGLDVLLFDDLFLVALDLVGKLGLLGGELGDFLDAFGVEDVVGIEHLDRRLFEIVDGGVLEHIAVEVGADDLEDGFAELVAVLIELGEKESLADGLESLGELRVKQVADFGLAGGAQTTDGVRHLDDVRLHVVDADEEDHFDIRADVVLTDQAVLARPVHLDAFHRDIDEFRAVDDGHDKAAVEDDLGLAATGADEGAALLHLAPAGK